MAADCALRCQVISRVPAADQATVGTNICEEPVEQNPVVGQGADPIVGFGASEGLRHCMFEFGELGAVVRD